MSLYVDVVRLIFEQFNVFSVFEEDKADRAACARCARVCRAWSEPALKVLWRTFSGSLLPLYAILLPPSDAVKKGFGHKGDRAVDTEVRVACIEYVRQILNEKHFDKPHTWARFLYYAALIRHIFNWAPVSDIGLLSVLLDHNGGQTFFPRLQSLSWSDRPVTIEICGHILLGLTPPSLTYFDYTIDQTLPLKVIADTLKGLAKAAPLMSRLHIHAHPRTTPHLDILPHLAGFERLRQLRLSGHLAVNAPSLASSSLPFLVNLEHLECQLEGFDDSQRIQGVLDAPRLEYLYPSGTCNNIAGFVRSLHAPRVQQVGVSVREAQVDYDPTSHTRLCHAIATSSFAHSLHKLLYTSKPAQRKGIRLPLLASSPAPLLDVARPLFALKWLRSVCFIYSLADTILLDEDVREMAKAWPKLETLSVVLRNHDKHGHHSDQTPEGRGTRPTPDALLHLAQHCPSLAYLAIPVDVERHGGFAVLDLPPASVPPQHRRLRNLKLLGSKCKGQSDEKMKALGRLLDGVFPELEIPQRLTYPDGWEPVWDEMRQLQRQRGGGGTSDTGRDMAN